MLSRGVSTASSGFADTGISSLGIEQKRAICPGGISVIESALESLIISSTSCRVAAPSAPASAADDVWTGEDAWRSSPISSEKLVAGCRIFRGLFRSVSSRAARRATSTKNCV
eukprot:scaffold1741_cov262-Pinguiococcus_pyrenoidosus.AAC.11